MTNRIPLIVNPGAGEIQELALGDQLDLGTSNLVNANNITANYFYGDGSHLTGISGSAGEAPFTQESSNFNAAVGTRYGVNTASSAITATLPATPATGDAIYFAQAGGSFAVNNLLVDPQSNTIMGSAGTLVVNVANQSFGLFYNGATWRIYV